MSKRLWPSLLLLTHEDADAFFIYTLLNKLPRGNGGVILRAYALGQKIRLTLGRNLAQLCRSRRLVFLVAIRNSTDLTIADVLRADGLHLPEWVAHQQNLAPMLSWCRRRRRLLTVAAHGQSALAKGRQLRADAILFSPVFSTLTHRNVPPIGVIRFSALCQKKQFKIVALGGIRSSNIHRLQHSKVIGIAIGQPPSREEDL